MTRELLPLFDKTMLGPALIDAVKKLDPRVQWRNPVMFVVYIGTIATALLFVQALGGHGEAATGFIFAITVWLAFVRQLCRSARRRPQSGSSHGAAQYASNRPRQETD